MYPHVSLTIKNHVPSIVYHPKEGVEKKMNIKDENIYDIAFDVANKLDLIGDANLSKDEQFDELLTKARESDEKYVTDLTDINPDVIEFELNDSMSRAVEKAIKTKSNEYEGVEMPDEIRKELDLNQNKDIFASLMDAMYTVLIAKTVLAAAELGIGKIALNDSSKNARLHEKMLQELHKLGIEYITDLQI